MSPKILTVVKGHGTGGKMKIRYPWLLSVAIVLCGPALGGKAKKAPWDCVRDGLNELLPTRVPIEEAAQGLEETLRHRTEVKGVVADRSKAFLIVHVTTAEALRWMDANYIQGYQGYAVTAELGLEHPSVPHPIYPSGDQRNTHLYEQALLVKFSEAGAQQKKQGRQVAYAHKRKESPESKMGVELRAQLASDKFRVTGGYNPDRRILVAVHPARLHWDYLENQFSDGIGIPSEADLNAAAPGAVADFQINHQSLGMKVYGKKPIFGGSAYYLLITVPNFASLLNVLKDENVSTADIAENFDYE